jgi:hypothetical protein
MTGDRFTRRILIYLVFILPMLVASLYYWIGVADRAIDRRENERIEHLQRGIDSVQQAERETLGI